MSTLEKHTLEQVASLVPSSHMLAIFSPEDLPELRQVLDRAMNTWEPERQPTWLQGFSDTLDRRLAKCNP